MTLDTVTPRTNLLGLTREEMESFFVSLGEKKFRAAQVMKWIHHEGCADFASMTNLSKALRTRLEELAEIRGPRVVYEGTSQDGTRKWVLEVEDGSYVETVLIPETLDTHRMRLRDSGFSAADVWFQCFNFASLLAFA